LRCVGPSIILGFVSKLYFLARDACRRNESLLFQSENSTFVPSASYKRFLRQSLDGGRAIWRQYFGRTYKAIAATGAMANLIARGNDENQYWRRELLEGEVIRLGRAPRQGWAVPWDVMVSREHADLELHGEGLHVQALETARNPIFYDNADATDFVVAPGGEFQIGRTTFQFSNTESIQSSNTTFIEHTYTRSELQAVKFKNSDLCLDAIYELPRLISDAASDDQFATDVVELILDALQDVAVVAVIQFDASADYDSSDPKLMRWNSHSKTLTRFVPSRQLMTKVLQRRCSAIHLWDRAQESAGFTMSGNLDWAFCTPIPTNQDRWCLYVSGCREFGGIDAIESPTDLLSELRFAELTANFIGAIRNVRTLERQQSKMRQFFSPAIVEMLVKNQAKSLVPCEWNIAVLFCDVRDFSRKVEQSRNNLDILLKRVSQALSAMTRGILRYEGVIADFQGDASLAFWGWPEPLDGDPLSACRAALTIHNTFHVANRDAQHPLNGFHIGLALGYGHAIAGQIGADEQIKVGVFGPVVNMTSRLEGITKLVGAPILLDASMAEAVREQLPAEEAVLRRIARMRPKGVDTAVTIYQLIPTGPQYDTISPEQLAQYDQAVDAFIEGDWRQAEQLLEGILPNDGPANYLRGFLSSSNAEPPDDWDGTIRLTAK